MLPALASVPQAVTLVPEAAAETAIGEFAGLTRGHLGLAASRTIGVYLLPAVLNEFRRLYPGITVDLAVSNTEHVEETVLAYEPQLGLVEGPYDVLAFDATVIGRDELIAVAGADHPMARKRCVSAVEVGSAELVMREPGSGTRAVIENAYARHEYELSPKLSVGSAEAIKRMLLLGNAVCRANGRRRTRYGRSGATAGARPEN